MNLSPVILWPWLTVLIFSTYVSFHIHHIKCSLCALFILNPSSDSATLVPCSSSCTSPLSNQRDGLRGLKGVALLQLLPSLDAARLDAEHAVPAVLGGKVPYGGRLVDPGVPDNDLVEVVADDTETLGAGLGDDDWVLGTLGGGIDTVSLAGEGDGGRLCLLIGSELVDVSRVLKTRNLGGVDVLEPKSV